MDVLVCAHPDGAVGVVPESDVGAQPDGRREAHEVPECGVRSQASVARVAADADLNQVAGRDCRTPPGLKRLRPQLLESPSQLRVLKCGLPHHVTQQPLKVAGRRAPVRGECHWRLFLQCDDIASKKWRGPGARPGPPDGIEFHASGDCR
jgi:hypothetical protein